MRKFHKTLSIGAGLAFTIIANLNAAAPAFAEHGHIVKHGFLLLGTNEVFATHIVAPPPHNWQVNLQLSLDQATLKAYLATKASGADGDVILVLDPIDIAQLKGATYITGDIIQKAYDGTIRPIATHISLVAGEFRVLYSRELSFPSKAYVTTDTRRLRTNDHFMGDKSMPTVVDPGNQVYRGTILSCPGENSFCNADSDCGSGRCVFDEWGVGRCQ
jgi:hypothetical protein